MDHGLPRLALLWAAALMASAVSVLSLLFTLFLSFGANLKDHYASNTIAMVVLAGLWLFLANAVMLAAYRMGHQR